MMAQPEYPIIFLPSTIQSIPYTSPRSGGGGMQFPQRNRISHGQRIQTQLQTAWQEAEQVLHQRQAAALPTKDGIYLEFSSQAGMGLLTKSLESIRSEIRLLNVRAVGEGENAMTFATVYIPSGKQGYFIRKVEKYLSEETKSGIPKNQPLVNSIEDVRLAILESFWQDEPTLLPGENPVWCEAWLRCNNDHVAVLDGFRDICGNLAILIKPERTLEFPERLIVLINANRAQLSQLTESSENIAEFRYAREVASVWMKEPPKEQAHWVRDLLGRLTIDAHSMVAVSILDTGVNNGHPLIEPILPDEDRQTCSPDWGVDDHAGHGTAICGLVIYNRLEEILESSLPVSITHKVESVKVLPPRGYNDPELYGHITQQAVSRLEIQAPDRKRVVCMAVSDQNNRYHRGRPSSWSGAIDALAFGESGEGIKRLLIISAGNAGPDEWKNYPDANLTYSVESPGQSWNALTVGAYTDLTRIEDPDFSGYHPLAEPGALSPFSSTSLVWEGKKWPIKPDILMEGGNLLADDSGFLTESDDTSLLTTYYRPTERQFDTMNMTSAATAKAAWFAARIQVSYPDAWPETVRGLIVHSADWPDALFRQFSIGESRADFGKLLRIAGYGVPNLQKALYCANNTLTLIAQESIQPFRKHEKESRYVTNEMHLHNLPWPREVLLTLGETPVKLRVTLSYFIEPSPGEIGWEHRYRYQSFGLRFDINTPNENLDEFVKRMNKAARDEEGQATTSGDSTRWRIGSQNRNLGSLHSDIWEGTAADIASCSFIGIYPTIGWWRERPHLGKYDHRVRYSLIVSLETPEIDVDIYTPVSTMIRVPVKIKT